ncbi:protein of unknown function [Rhodovastum atsumiense]|nr:protein of unknown function [Rhodovastum atsumiense]
MFDQAAYIRHFRALVGGAKLNYKFISPQWRSINGEMGAPMSGEALRCDWTRVKYLI